MMDTLSFTTPSTIHNAFSTFEADQRFLALPLVLQSGLLTPLSAVEFKDPSALQISLNELDSVLNSRIPLFLIMRRNNSLVAITFAPYLAKESDRKFFLEHRHEIVRQLGEDKFSQTLICKEIGEITDARSWIEREENATSAAQPVSPDRQSSEKKCGDEYHSASTIKDLGYARNKCRLCDRRMKNEVTPETLDALKSLTTPRAFVQIHVDLPTLTLHLLTSKTLPPDSIQAHIPTTCPTFSFYNHPGTALLYFIFHSPDSASVQQRMKHTMAIPGLLVHAEDMGINVDQKVEIHEPDELVFEDVDKRVGRFRSVFVRKGYRGTELGYEGLERDREWTEAVR